MSERVAPMIIAPAPRPSVTRGTIWADVTPAADRISRERGAGSADEGTDTTEPCSMISLRRAARPKKSSSCARWSCEKPMACRTRSVPSGSVRNNAPFEIPAASSVAASTSRNAMSMSALAVNALATPLNSASCAA